MYTGYFDVFKATEEDISLAKKQNCDNNEKNQRKQEILLQYG